MHGEPVRREGGREGGGEGGREFYSLLPFPVKYPTLIACSTRELLPGGERIEEARRFNSKPAVCGCKPSKT